MSAIPFDQPELLKSARAGDEVLEIVRPIPQIPSKGSEEYGHFRFLLRNLSSFPSERTISVPGRTLLLKHTGGGLLGKGNINILIRPAIVTHAALYFYVRHWKVIE